MSGRDAAPAPALRVAVLVDTPKVSRYLLDLLEWLAGTEGIVLAGVHRAARGYPPRPAAGDIDAPDWAAARRGARPPRGGWTGVPTARLFFAIDRIVGRLPRAGDVRCDRGVIAPQPLAAGGIDCDLLIRAGADDAAGWHAARGARYGAIGLDFAIDADPVRSAAGLDEPGRGEHETGFVLYRIVAPGPRAGDVGPPGLNRQSRVSPWPANVIRHGWYRTRGSAARNRMQLYGNALRVLKDAVLQCARVHAQDGASSAAAPSPVVLPTVALPTVALPTAALPTVASPWPADPQAVHDGGRPVAAMLNPRRLGTPSLGRQIAYGYRLTRRLVRALKRRAGGRGTGGSLGVMRNGHPLTMAFGSVRPLLPPRRCAWADPFIVAPQAPDQAPVVLVEQRSRKGSHIAALVLTGEGKSALAGEGKSALAGDGTPSVAVEDLGPVLQASHRLAFPFVFRWQGDHYLCPGAADSGRITVYRAADFPRRWEPAAVLMDGVSATGTMLFESAGRWWMLTNLDRSATARLAGTGDLHSELHLFHADSPLAAQWTPHPLNPLRIDCRGARNAGLLVEPDGLYRCGRISRFDGAGQAVALYRIMTLTPEHYREVLVRVVEPGHLTNLSALSGVQTWSRAGAWTVIDLQHRGRLRGNDRTIGVTAGRGRMGLDTGE